MHHPTEALRSKVYIPSHKYIKTIFSTLVEIGFRSHDFDDETKISFSISSSVSHSKNVFLDFISGFCTWDIRYSIWTFRTNSFNFICNIFREIVTK